MENIVILVKDRKGSTYIARKASAQWNPMRDRVWGRVDESISSQCAWLFVFSEVILPSHSNPIFFWNHSKVLFYFWITEYVKLLIYFYSSSHNGEIKQICNFYRIFVKANRDLWSFYELFFLLKMLKLWGSGFLSTYD